MAKTIRTIDDLSKIAGAELGENQTKPKIEQPKKAVTTKLTKPITVARSDTKSGDVVKGKTVDYLSDTYNAFEVGYIKYFPNREMTLDEIRTRPNPVNDNTRGNKSKDLPKLIKAEWARVEHFKQIYLNGLAIGHNNTGYVHASIMAEREALRLEAYQQELTEKA